MNNVFKSDHRKENPGLHALYVKWALEHLAAARRCREYMGSFSNWNATQFVFAIDATEQKLIAENAAYAEAWDIMQRLEAEHGMRFRKIRRYVTLPSERVTEE